MDDIKRRHGQDRVSKRIVEQIVGVTVAHVMEDIVDVVKQIVQGHGDGLTRCSSKLKLQRHVCCSDVSD